MKDKSDNKVDEFMLAAIAEAEIGMSEGGIPIGSVLVRQGEIIGRGHNRRVQTGDPTAHAEIDCLKNSGRIGNYDDCVIYSTLMPCAMCAGAVIQFGIGKVVAGEDRTFSSFRSVMEANGVEVIDLDLDQCYDLLAEFAGKHPQIWMEDIGEL